MAPKAGARYRSPQISIDERQLYSDLAVLASDGGTLKTVAWQWDGSHYPKSSKGSGADRDAMTISVPVLEALVAAARSGFPCAKGVRRVLAALDQECGILKTSKDADKGQLQLTITATDNWKRMLADMVFFKRSSISVANPQLQAVIDSIVDAKPEHAGSVGRSVSSTTSNDSAGTAIVQMPSMEIMHKEGLGVQLAADGYPLVDVGAAVAGSADATDDDDDVMEVTGSVLTRYAGGRVAIDVGDEDDTASGKPAAVSVKLVAVPRQLEA